MPNSAEADISSSHNPGAIDNKPFMRIAGHDCTHERDTICQEPYPKQNPIRRRAAYSISVALFSPADEVAWTYRDLQHHLNAGTGTVSATPLTSA